MHMRILFAWKALWIYEYCAAIEVLCIIIYYYSRIAYLLGRTVANKLEKVRWVKTHILKLRKST